VEREHIVQDSCSDDATQDWLPNDPRVKAFIEPDQGMYDAVNRGYQRATGDILAYLNCDEQYLPGSLVKVREFFEQHPKVEVLLAGSIIVDGQGNYICHRQLMPPNPRHIWYRFPFLTSSVFIRRRVIHERGILFDPRWRDLGDFHWVLALLKNKVPMAACNVFTSTFADTGENMNFKPKRPAGKAGDRPDGSGLAASVQAVLDIEPLVAPAAGRTFQIKAHELRDLHPAKPGNAD
jgi:glycosyltransferase involved in cell wall biosynthesis